MANYKSIDIPNLEYSTHYMHYYNKISNDLFNFHPTDTRHHYILCSIPIVYSKSYA